MSLSYLPSFGATRSQSHDEMDSSSGRYISCSKDGMLLFWSLDFKIQKCVMVSISYCRHSNEIFLIDLFVDVTADSPCALTILKTRLYNVIGNKVLALLRLRRPIALHAPVAIGKAKISMEHRELHLVTKSS